MITTIKNKEFFHTKPLSHKGFHTMKSMKILFIFASAQVETTLLIKGSFSNSFPKTFIYFFFVSFVPFVVINTHWLRLCCSELFVVKIEHLAINQSSVSGRLDLRFFSSAVMCRIHLQKFNNNSRRNNHKHDKNKEILISNQFLQPAANHLRNHYAQ